MGPVTAVLALLPAAALLTGLTSATATLDADLKGARGVLVDGDALDAQIRIMETREATGLMIGLFQSTRTNRASAAAPIPGRACFRVSLIYLTPENMDVPNDALTVEDAHVTYWLYPAVEEEPAVLVAETGAWAPVAETGAYAPVENLISRLAEHGVPASGSRGRAASCARPPAP